jgi:hypothetical protein
MTPLEDLNRLKSLVRTYMLNHYDDDLHLMTGHVHGTGFHGCGPFHIDAMFRGTCHSRESQKKELVPAVNLPIPYRLGHKHLQESRSLSYAQFPMFILIVL